MPQQQPLLNVADRANLVVTHHSSKAVLYTHAWESEAVASQARDSDRTQAGSAAAFRRRGSLKIRFNRQVAWGFERQENHWPLKHEISCPSSLVIAGDGLDHLCLHPQLARPSA